MRLNKYIAQSTGLSRRAADTAISEGRVAVNGQAPKLGQDIAASDSVTLDGRPLTASTSTQTIMLNKPVGYICSRDGQGGRTIYDLLPAEYHHLKPVGRLDKHSSGLLLLTSDGQLAYELTHPKFQKEKIYEVRLDSDLTKEDQAKIAAGVMLDDGPSRLKLKPLGGHDWQVIMNEGRNRQIRRTFEALGHNVRQLHRTQFGSYKLNQLQSGKFAPEQI
jgi:23S rRNA pseudouridine2605 synthase